MKLSLNWLNDYIDIGTDAEWIAATLSDLGFPVEGIEPLDNDTVLDVEVTSNRGDCLGHIGLARELSVATGKPLTGSVSRIAWPAIRRPAADSGKRRVRNHRW